jgi:hypothetical protein
MSLFLDNQELAKLTGRKIKSLQIEWLRKEGVPFRINATGHPVVTRSVIDNRSAEPVLQRTWTPRVVGIGA